MAIHLQPTTHRKRSEEILLRRKDGTALVKNEELVLSAALHLHRDGETQYHGYRLNGFLDEHDRKLVASTLYRILHRLEEREFMTSHWEQAPGGTQWRCVFTLTGEGVTAAEEVVANAVPHTIALNPGM